MSNIPLTDLRKNNLVLYREGVVRIRAIGHYFVTSVFYDTEDTYLITNGRDSISGIPISEEWLERTNVKDIIPEYNNAIISIEETDNGYIFELDIPRAGFYKISREMKYLHDLQNVVKELFGTELTLKQ